MASEQGNADPDRDALSQASVEAAQASHSLTVPVVGLGASAGGIEAFTEFFAAMPEKSGAAFVLVLHLDPTRESQLSSVVARHTPMPVSEITDGMEIRANHVYVIAPAFDVTLVGDTLRLRKPAQPRGHTHPVDALFRSLAEQRAERAVAIILSGTGTNGTQGLREVKAAGGLILVEDPADARFDGMPRSAIGAGLADRVLSPGKMPGIVVDYLRHGYVAEPDGHGTLPHGRSSELDPLLTLLRAHSGQEFRDYKPATLLRRINRRMGLNNLATFNTYIEFLRADPEEVRALVRDLLISVTGFFRDPEAWATLDELVITQLVADRESGAAIRVWVPACATGEEAYSIAMLLMERAEAAHKQFDIKVFASDVVDENLNAGRAGTYPSASAPGTCSAILRATGWFLSGPQGFA